MKKLAITIAIVLGLGMTALAASGNGGLFKRGVADEEYYGMGNYDYFNNGRGLRAINTEPIFPQHNQDGNGDADEAPLGAGVVLLMGLGGAYLVAKKRREE